VKRVFVLIPLFFCLFIGSAFAANLQPTQKMIDDFKAAHPSSEFTYGTYTVYLNNGDVKTNFYALPLGVTISFKTEGSKLYQMHSKFTTGSSFVVFWNGTTGSLNFAATSGQWHMLYEDVSKVVENGGGTDPGGTEPGGETVLEGVGLEEIPAQMVRTGGIVLPVALMVLGGLLTVGLVRRFPHWFLRF
jgi:hypothetical protein